jgi:hypothetical protein
MALEALKMTNLDGNIYFILKEINKLDVDKRLEYRDFVLSAIQGREHGNKVYSAVIKCSVAPECEDVVLEGNDEIKVDLSINAQPKAVVRISRK